MCDFVPCDQIVQRAYSEGGGVNQPRSQGLWERGSGLTGGEEGAVGHNRAFTVFTITNAFKIKTLRGSSEH